MPVPTIYYIRHGETSWNAEGRLQGVQDIALNERGRAQALAMGGNFYQLRDWSDDDWKTARESIMAQNEKDRAKRG